MSLISKINKQFQGPWYTSIIHCPLPKSFKNGDTDWTVSLVSSKSCQDRLSNALTVQNPKTEPKKRDIMLCMGGILYPKPGFAIRLVEWMELQREMGIDKVTST